MVTDAHRYQFVTRWQVAATCGEVADIIGDPLALPRWWPAVYLDAKEIDPADARGLGRRVRFHTTGWLPYTLHWESVVTRSDYPSGFTIRAHGDFEGTGAWTFVQRGEEVEVSYDWRVSAEKPLLRELSFLLKPLFSANHRWAMAQGETSLKLELERRRAESEVARQSVPPPPGPVTYTGVALVGGAVVVGAGLVYLMRQSRRSRLRRRSA